MSEIDILGVVMMMMLESAVNQVSHHTHVKYSIIYILINILAIAIAELKS